MIFRMVEFSGAVSRSSLNTTLSPAVWASAAKCLQEDGCLRMEVFVPEGQENKLVLSELWRDEAALKVHRNQAGHAEDHAHID